jgi:hypothetical protein
MTSDRKKPGVAFWATVVVVCLPIAYVLSFGPACWISSRTCAKFTPRSRRGHYYVPVLGTVYWPLLQLAGRTRIASWYSTLGAEKGWELEERGGRFSFVNFERYP